MFWQRWAGQFLMVAVAATFFIGKESGLLLLDTGMDTKELGPVSSADNNERAASSLLLDQTLLAGKGSFVLKRQVISITNDTCSLVVPDEDVEAPSLTARLFVFQQDEELLDIWVEHHRQVLADENLVIINHNNRKDRTSELKQNYPRMHIWNCRGNFLNKGTMVASVIEQYRNYTGFVIPLDVDELMAVRTTQEEWVWTAKEFYESLTSLHEEHFNESLAFKFETIAPVPIDCRGFERNETARSRNSLSPSVTVKRSNICRLEFGRRHFFTQIRKWPCQAKSFARGREYAFSDHGNHNTLTHNQGTMTSGKCKGKPAHAWSRLGLVHVQEFLFADWYLHALRGASNLGMNSLSANCKSNQVGGAYCKDWKLFVGSKFDPKVLEKHYKRRFCPSPGDVLPNQRISDISNVFDHLCQRTV